MAQLADFLKQKFPKNNVAPSHFGELLCDYQQSGMAPPNMIKEVTSGDDGKFWAFIWESMLHRYLTSLGFPFRESRARKSGQDGPDFGIVINGQTVWIEAVTPSPEHIPQDWLEPPRIGEVRVKSMPHEAMLLRWTSVVKDKRGKFENYIERGIVDAADCRVIAVNSCRLSDFAMDDQGISQLPFAVEAVFPIGPLGVPVSLDGSAAGNPKHVTRWHIQKPNGASVPTENFLDPAYSVVSALVGCYRKDVIDGTLPLTVVHNPLAATPLPKKVLRATKEYVAENRGDHYLLHPLHDGIEEMPQ